ncbi:MAG: F0F1 ATP synthase subunit B [Rhizobiaceae bacterium]
MFFVTKAYAEDAKPAVEGQAEGATHGAAGQTVHTETGVAQEGEHGGVFPPFDSSTYASQLLWLAITFGAFYLLLSRVIAPRISSILDTRRDRIARDLADAAKMKEEADAAVAAYEQDLASARKNAVEIGNKARDVAKAEAETKRKSAESGLEAKLADAEKRIAKIRAAGMAEVGKIAEETAGAILTQLTGGKISASDIASAIKSVKG